VSRKRRIHHVQPRRQRPTPVEQSPQDFLYKWIEPEDAMAHLSVHSRSALYRLIDNHRLPCSRVGRYYRFRRADLDAWMTNNRPALAAVERAGA
jgi:excisionase family DNA binding protein